MQTVTQTFVNRANASMRPLSWRFLASFDKEYVSGTDFFTIGVSSIGSDDIIKGTGDVLQEWDKYVYEDYSERVISCEWSRQQDVPFSVALGMMDITLDNHDDFFTPGGNSVIAPNILPYRPVKFFSGFRAGNDSPYSGENIQQFVGLIEKMPEVSESSKTVTFHCIDFLSSLMDRPMDEALMYEDYRVDQIISELLESFGLVPAQFDMGTAFTVVDFFFADKGEKFGDIANKLVQADLGNLFMDENGIITYRNRQDFNDTPVYTFTNNNIIDLQTSKQDDLITVVEVKADARSVQPSQKIWESTEGIAVGPGLSVEVWADFSEPVTSADDPLPIAVATTSLYSANLQADGSGADYVEIDLVSTDLFSKSMKMTFNNGGLQNAYITGIQLFGTPAPSVRKVYARQESAQDDLDQFGERVYAVDNDFIQDDSTATSLALILLNLYGEFGIIQELQVKGSPALQLSDTVTVVITESSGGTRTDNYFISGLENNLSSGGFNQRLTLKKREQANYFTIGESEIGGGDLIAP